MRNLNPRLMLTKQLHRHECLSGLLVDRAGFEPALPRRPITERRRPDTGCGLIDSAGDRAGRRIDDKDAMLGDWTARSSSSTASRASRPTAHDTHDPMKPKTYGAKTKKTS